MAAVASAVPREVPALTVEPPKPVAASIKSYAEDDGLTSIPSTYVFKSASELGINDPQDSVPIIDFSLLTSGNPDQRSKAVHDLVKACQDWGFFMVTNHGVPEGLMKAMVDACRAFFDLTEEEKRVYAPKHILSPIKAGTSFNRCDEKAVCWRDYLNLHLHPKFHCTDKPQGLSEVLSEYNKATREVALILMRRLSESLGLEEGYIEKASDQDNGFSLFTSNLYPPCPQPELAMGIAPHTDDGLLNLLIQNGVGGLQLLHDGKWINVNAAPNCYLVNVGDHIEIMSNGKFKSVLHRATVNNNATRMSIVVAVSPSVDAVIEPIPELIDDKTNPPKYRPMKYGDYLQVVHSDYAASDVLGIVRIEEPDADVDPN